MPLITVQNSNWIPLINVTGPITTPIEVSDEIIKRLKQLGFTVRLAAKPIFTKRETPIVEPIISPVVEEEITEDPMEDELLIGVELINEDTPEDEENVWTEEEIRNSLKERVTKKVMMDYIRKAEIEISGKENKEDLIDIIIANDIHIDEIFE
jgi:hypothetical protein